MARHRSLKSKQTGNQGKEIGATPVKSVTALSPVLLVLTGLVAYSNSFAGVFLLDDYDHILTNERIRQFLPLSNLLSTTRPLVTLSLAFNYWIDNPTVPHKLNPEGFHIFNLLIHLLAALTLFGLVRRTLQLPSLSASCKQSAHGLALSVALLWMVHPIQTQSVTYIIQRGESMMGFFFLLTLYCLNRSAKSSKSVIWGIAAVVACASGMASKAVMVTAPVLAILYDRLFLSDTFRQVLRQRWLLHLGIAATWVIPFLVGTVQGVLDSTPRDSVSVGFGYTTVSPLAYLSAQPGVLLHYLRLALWPAGQCLDYQWEIPRATSEMLWPAIPIFLLIAASIVAIRRRPGFAFLGAWFFLILAPTSSFIPIKDLAFEHRMYLPLAAVITAIILLVHRVLLRWIDHDFLRRVISTGLLAVAVVALGFATHRRNQDYRSEIAMWTDVTTKRPKNARAHVNLGICLSRNNRLNEALSAYHKAVKLDPESWRAHTNLGKVLAKKGRYAEAVSSYQSAITLGANNIDIRHSLAVALAETGRMKEAMERYREVLSIDPSHPHARYNLAMILAQTKRQNEAVEQFRLHLKAHAEDVTAHLNLATTLLQLNQLDAAVTGYREAVRLNPRDATVHYYLGVALEKQRKYEEAIQSYRSALAIKPDYEPARRALRAVLEKQRAGSP